MSKQERLRDDITTTDVPGSVEAGQLVASQIYVKFAGDGLHDFNVQSEPVKKIITHQLFMFFNCLCGKYCAYKLVSFFPITTEATQNLFC